MGESEMIGRFLAMFRRRFRPLASGLAWEWRPTPTEPIRLPPHLANVAGPFYVEDGCCLSCGVWEEEAPGLLAWLPDSDIPHCYVARQPETDAEFGQMMAAMRVGKVDCIRVHACRPDWARRLREEGLGHHIDPAEGPVRR